MGCIMKVLTEHKKSSTAFVKQILQYSPLSEFLTFTFFTLNFLNVDALSLLPLASNSQRVANFELAISYSRVSQL